MEEKIVAMFLPNHAAFRAHKKKIKYTIVFDTSAKGKDIVSINDCVVSGPAL